MHDTPAPPASPSARPSSYRLALVAAVARNGVIGIEGTLPWRIPEDLRGFRPLTTGHSIVMGRKTWESLGRALPDRQNIVVSRREKLQVVGATVAHSLQEAVSLAALPAPVCVIGGSELYRAALPIADVLYITEIDADFAGDVSFPDYDRSLWLEVAREQGSPAASSAATSTSTSTSTATLPDFSYSFVTYRKTIA